MKSCQVCGSSSMQKVVDLGEQPPSDAFLTEEKLNWVENKYPLQLFYCRDCKLVQLSHAVDPKILFGDDFVYQTGFSVPLKNHLQELAGGLAADFMEENDLAVDIGSNDGSLLEGYPKYVRILGVEPAIVAKVAAEKGIPTVKEFFSAESAGRIAEKHGKAKVITATNVFAHVRDLDSFMEGVEILLDTRGVFVTESHYFLDLVQHLEYDTIYHEHLRYYTLESLVGLFSRFGMDVFRAERTPVHGGSIRTYACRKGDYKVEDSVGEIIRAEKKAAVNDNLLGFAEKVSKNREALRKLVAEIRSGGNRIVGIGAPAKSTTLLNFCGIGDELDYIVEKSGWKIGRYTPGTHVKIKDESALFEDQPEYVILLSWNLKDHIVPKLRQNGYRGKIIVPIPEPHII